MKQGYSIGDLSRRTGVKVSTIRFYEGRGLLPEPGRTAGNQRRYGADELQRLAFIAHARQLGFAIEAIESLLDLSTQAEQPHGTVRQIANGHLGEVRERIASLRSLEEELQRIVARCDGTGSGTCRIIEAIGDHSLCKQDH